MQSLTWTKHAITRQQQRGISATMVDTVLQYGKKTFLQGGCFLLMVPKKRIKLLHLSDDVSGVGLVLSGNTLVTVEHVKKIFRKKRVNRNWRREQ